MESRIWDFQLEYMVLTQSCVGRGEKMDSMLFVYRSPVWLTEIRCAKSKGSRFEEEEDILAQR